jgi:hydroxyacylglutathione hydrolase
LLVLDRPDDLWDVTWQLLRIGYDAPAGWLSGGMHAWRTAGEDVELLQQVTAPGLAELVSEGRVRVVDVRQPAEWVSGRIPGAQFITGAELPERLEEIPRDEPIAVVCGSAFRSSVAASLLKRNGFDDVMNVVGGMSAWRAHSLPLEK